MLQHNLQLKYSVENCGAQGRLMVSASDMTPGGLAVKPTVVVLLRQILNKLPLCLPPARCIIGRGRGGGGAGGN